MIVRCVVTCHVFVETNDLAQAAGLARASIVHAGFSDPQVGKVEPDGGEAPTEDLGPPEYSLKDNQKYLTHPRSPEALGIGLIAEVVRG